MCDNRRCVHVCRCRHEVNMRDKALIAYLIDKFESGGSLERLAPAECASLPFNVLHRW